MPSRERDFRHKKIRRSGIKQSLDFCKHKKTGKDMEEHTAINTIMCDETKAMCFKPQHFRVTDQQRDTLPR
jgi:hypothetical protein